MCNLIAFLCFSGLSVMAITICFLWTTLLSYHSLVVGKMVSRGLPVLSLLALGNQHDGIWLTSGSITSDWRQRWWGPEFSNISSWISSTINLKVYKCIYMPVDSFFSCPLKRSVVQTNDVTHPLMFSVMGFFAYATLTFVSIFAFNYVVLSNTTLWSFVLPPIYHYSKAGSLDSQPMTIEALGSALSCVAAPNWMVSALLNSYHLELTTIW